MTLFDNLYETKKEDLKNAVNVLTNAFTGVLLIRSFLEYGTPLTRIRQSSHCR